MVDVLLQYGLFLAKIVTIVVALGVLFGTIFSLMIALLLELVIYVSIYSVDLSTPESDMVDAIRKQMYSVDG